jgi:hypothetical protein
MNIFLFYFIFYLLVYYSDFQFGELTQMTQVFFIFLIKFFFQFHLLIVVVWELDIMVCFVTFY